MKFSFSDENLSFSIALAQMENVHITNTHTKKIENWNR